MTIRVLPDWEQIAASIEDRQNLAQELQKAFEMGYSAGYIDGDEKGYQDHWEKSYTSKEGH